MEQKKIDIEQVRQVAKLARLDLNEEEIAQFSGQLSSILGYVEKINQLDTSKAEPLAHCLPINNCLRADEIKPSLGTDKTLSNAPDRDEHFFVMPKILDES
ncbi:MAG: asparaginyl/glutamyl-tRNA amidotransferase subunit C [Planctomycetes bacterium GWF2_42_9]|nr:MAG: asparaginyl/glutamyl-tRNA amidotransferase subunit C [Planctomycetes bacterium GWF2_42_9]HAL45451.1 Asp-tRNA(Asn)/Glu-tRNA(Gln) amidotransferase GatCAB subunit C [Phycisphaerales bacterium]